MYFYVLSDQITSEKGCHITLFILPHFFQLNTLCNSDISHDIQVQWAGNGISCLPWDTTGLTSNPSLAQFDRMVTASSVISLLGNVGFSSSSRSHESYWNPTHFLSLGRCCVSKWMDALDKKSFGIICLTSSFRLLRQTGAVTLCCHVMHLQSMSGRWENLLGSMSSTKQSCTKTVLIAA